MEADRHRSLQIWFNTSLFPAPMYRFLVYWETCPAAKRQSRDGTGLQALKGVNTEKAEKSFLCNRGKLVGIDIKDGKKPTRSIPSLRAQRRGSNQGTLAPAFSFTGENKSHTFLTSCPGQLKPSVLSLSPRVQPKDSSAEHHSLKTICSL